MVFFICSLSHMIYFCFLHQWLGWEFAEGLAEVSWDSRDQVDHNQVLAGVYEEQRLQRVLDVVEEPQGFYWAVIVTFTCWIEGSRIATQFKRINKLGIVDWNQWTSVETFLIIWVPCWPLYSLGAGHMLFASKWFQSMDGISPLLRISNIKIFLISCDSKVSWLHREKQLQINF